MDIVQQHKSNLRAYFDGAGFERWSAIYGQAEVSRIRQTIRDGHAEMLALAEQWLSEGARGWGIGDRGSASNPQSLSPIPAPQVLDAGCGTGLFSLALAQRGFDVTAVDFAPQMAEATAARARAAGLSERVHSRASDLEDVTGSYDAVVCFDVLVHYPRLSFARLCAHLARLTTGPLLLTYAPHEPLLAALHWLGGRFPKGERRTDIQMIPERFVRDTLAGVGMQVRRQARVSRGFYHVTLLEAHPASWRTFLEAI